MKGPLTFCAYCGVDHDQSVAFSNEEVVPHAIGGSREFTIRVCEKSNNDLGGRVDKPFIEGFAVRAKRFFLKLDGTDGTEPTLDLSGKSMIRGEEVNVKYLVGPGNKKQLTVAPKVTETLADNRLQRRLSGDPEYVREILLEMLRGARVKGQRVITPNGETLNESNLDAFLASKNTETVNPGIFKTISFDRLECARFFAKLALATAHYILGESFSRSDHAEVLRKVMHAKNLNEGTIPGAHIWPDIERAETALKPFRKENAHVLGFPTTKPLIFVASLFGGFDAVVPLGALGERKTLERREGQRIISIELPSRKFDDRTFEQYVLTLLPTTHSTL